MGTDAGVEGWANAQAQEFLELHRPGEPLLMPNPWDIGSATLLVHLGFRALATTSSGFAASLGRLDNHVSRDEAISHASEIAVAVPVPVSADLESGFGPAPTDVAETMRRACDAGLAGASIEDGTGDADDPLYDIAEAAERVAAAAEAARAPGGGKRLVLTARAENYVVGRRDISDVVQRLQRYQEAGADVLFAPGIRRPDDIHAVVTSVDRPVSVLILPGAPAVSEMGELGVARLSVGGALAFAAYGTVVRAARQLLDDGTYGYWDDAGTGTAAVSELFT